VSRTRNRRGKRPDLLTTFYLPCSGKPFKLVIQKGKDGYDAPVLDGGEYEEVLLRVEQGLDPRDNLELPYEEDRQYFIDVVLPHARRHIAEHYVHRSDLGEWWDVMQHYPRKRATARKVTRASTTKMRQP
jgi:hypothetical protein